MSPKRDPCRLLLLATSSAQPLCLGVAASLQRRTQSIVSSLALEQQLRKRSFEISDSMSADVAAVVVLYPLQCRKLKSRRFDGFQEEHLLLESLQRLRGRNPERQILAQEVLFPHDPARPSTCIRSGES